FGARLLAYSHHRRRIEMPRRGKTTAAGKPAGGRRRARPADDAPPSKTEGPGRSGDGGRTRFADFGAAGFDPGRFFDLSHPFGRLSASLLLQCLEWQALVLRSFQQTQRASAA